MSLACPGPDEVTGIAHGVLASVGCNSHRLAVNAYAALTAPTSFLPGALTICLTLYVGFLGFGLLAGSPSLRLTEVTKTGLKIGAVVALTLNWSIFQTLVFNIATEAPYEVGQIFARAGSTEALNPNGDDPLTRLEDIHQELTASADSLSQSAVPGVTASAYTAGQRSAPAEALYAMATTLIVCTVGLVALAMVAQAVLVALGPAFMLFFLFDSTRGLFVGWVRALAGAIIAPITSWGGLMVCLATLEPWVDQLAAERAAHEITLATISSLTTFVITFAVAQVVMALGAIVITSAFHLPRPRQPDTVATAGAGSTSTSQQSIEAWRSQSRAEQLAQSLNGAARSQSTTSEESRRLEVPTVGVARSSSDEAAVAAPRLGDAYRRPSPTGGLTRASGAVGGR